MADETLTKATVARAPAGAATADGAFAPTAPEDDQATTGEDTIIPAWAAGEAVSLPEPGYQLGSLIGRGGMGEVVVAHDQRIGREVAVKRIRSHQPSPDAVMRFLREARIQARLDHPAIVPVYELGTDASGRPYFTMKRLAGVTLAQKLEERGPNQARLRAIIDVCNAVGLAHSRGVVHRDLKPSNIMLGDYGEVYVLDWGVARVMTERRRQTKPSIHIDVDEGTTAGAILGTPGYMAPEQVRGHEVGPAADVYALGAILFEILAGESLHPRGSDAALASTLSRPQDAPARRAGDRAIAPELDELCVDALAEDPDARPRARELAMRVQAYVDGDRDVERRRALAAEQLALAQAALESGGDDARATAMRRAGRALALDPESQDAAQLVTSLILEPPEVLPPDLVASLADEAASFHRKRSRVGMWAYLGFFVLWPLFPFLNVKSWTWIVAFYGLISLAAFTSSRAATDARGRNPLVVTMTIMTLLLFGFTRIASPFILTPIVLCGMLASLSTVNELNRRPWLLFGWTIATVMLPYVLEWLGLVHATYHIANGLLVTRSDVFTMKGEIDELALVGTNLLMLIAFAAVSSSSSRNFRAAQREIHIRAWHLRHLLPSTGRAWATKTRRSIEG